MRDISDRRPAGAAASRTQGPVGDLGAAVGEVAVLDFAFCPSTYLLPYVLQKSDAYINTSENYTRTANALIEKLGSFTLTVMH